MKTRKTLIDRITQELHQLPEEYLDTVFGVVERMRAQFIKNKPSEQVDRSEPLPFVDEIERVKEQSGRGAGRMDDQTLA